jgi:sec-independent protein translocase protein TatB
MVFNGLTFEKLLLVGVIAVFLLGPDKLPSYAAKLGRLVRTLRDYANGAKARMKEEMGPEFDEVDWKKLDPRQYDPRRIIREALLDDEPLAAAPVVRPASRSESEDLSRKTEQAAKGVAAMGALGAADAAPTTPYDSEST